MTPKSLPGGCWKPDEQILAAIVDVNREEFCGSFDRALDVIEAAMDARRIALPRKRRTAIDVGIDLGPDHSAALTAVESLIKMMTAGRPRPKPCDSTPSGLAYDELEVVVFAMEVDRKPPEEREQARREIEQKFNRKWSTPKVEPLPTLPNLVAARRERIEALLHRARAVQRRAFEARKIFVPDNPMTPVDLGPDHRIALRAVGLLLDIMNAGRPNPKPPKSVYGRETIEELREQQERAEFYFANRNADEPD